MSSKNKKKKRPVSPKPQETAEHQDVQIYNIEDSAETTQNLYDVSQPEGADLSSASDDKVKKESPKPKTPAKKKKKKPASPKTPKKTEGNTDSDKEKASEPEKNNAITEPEITAETENEISAEIPENVFDLEKEISVETTESVPDSVTEVSAETEEKSSDSEKKDSSVKTQKPAKQTRKKKKKKKKPAAKATDNKQSASKESGRKAVYTLDESDESAEKPESSGKDNTEEHAAVYYDISEESEKEIKSEESGEETKPVIFSVDEQETAEDGKEDGRVMYDVSEADRQDKEEETLESIKNELQEMAEKSDQKEEKIDHYENSYLLDEESSETAETKPENRYLAWLKTAAAAVAAFITTPFKKLGSFISGLFRKPIPESTALSFNESGQIIPVQIVDSDGNIVDLNKPETIAKLPLFKRLSVYWRNFIVRIKEKIAARKEAKQQQAEQQPEEIIYKSPLARLKELIARIKEKIARKKEEEQAEQQQEAEEYEELEPADRRRLKVRRIANSFMGVVVFFVLLGALSGISTVGVILNKTDVVLDISDIRNQDSTRIFDDQGEQIAIVGHESRISVSYSSFPQVVVDAFVAIEDSRYFEHPGFDMPRFAKAFLENIKSLSFAQGGSTLTMQVIKNTYFAVDTIAEKGIDRKVQEIYYSLKINKIVSKEKIFELYVNKVNFGATARGIQVASQYYFGKDCNNLTLVEAALLAGLVQAPNLNNPYYHLNDCTQRTRQVLYQMKNHGYITEEEYNFACKVKIENLLIGTQEYKYGSGETVSNQAYIDIVLNELQEVYDINPYETPVLVYTCMNQEVQNYCDEVSRGNVVTFPDENINTSIVCIRNNTGELVGLCGGRDYDGKRMFN
ncbi:MAG: penicillin-binding protein, partial [Erysipelotrichaceae bacterium]|nr:penicillin-binding protein [Erysipelotrichaceae bacterium]